MTDVTVIIVNWNGGDWLKQCLDSVQQQTVKPDQIIVVDNASSDHSKTIALNTPGVDVLELDSNVGFAKANNEAIARCNTDYIALLNPDAIAHPDWLEQLLQSARQHPECGSWGSRQMIYGQLDRLDGIGDVYHITGLAWRSRHGKKLDSNDLKERCIFSPCACAALYRKQAVLDVGGFDDDYFCYFEDVDLGFRLQLAGYSSRYVPNAVVEHVGSYSSGGQRSDFAVYYGHRNLVWTYIKNMPSILFWMCLPLHLVLTIVSVVYFSIRGQSRAILRAKIDACYAIPGLWENRLKTQKKRKIGLFQLAILFNK